MFNRTHFMNIKASKGLNKTLLKKFHVTSGFAYQGRNAYIHLNEVLTISKYGDNVLIKQSDTLEY